MVLKKAIKVAHREAEKDIRSISKKHKEWFVVELDHGFEAVSEQWMKKIGRRIPPVYSTKTGLVGKPRNKKRYYLAWALLTIDERKRNLLFPNRNR